VIVAVIGQTPQRRRIIAFKRTSGSKFLRKHRLVDIGVILYELLAGRRPYPLGAAASQTQRLA
jgi:hypothetical protein